MTLNGAIKQLHELRCAEDMPIYYKPALAEVINVILMDAEPVKHGRLEWRKEKTIWQTGYYCSECQAFFGKDYDMVKYFNYCPNCGAKTDLNEGEEA